MKIRNILGLSFTNMRRRKTRTALTTLGIVVGIMAVVSISALSGGFESQITTQLREGLDMDILTIMPGGFLGGWGLTSLRMNDTIVIQNVTGVVATLGYSETVSTIYNETATTLNNETFGILRARMFGLNFTDLDVFYGHRLEFADGGFPDPTNNDSCIIGYLEDPIASVGDNISIEIYDRVSYQPVNVSFIVSGILNETGSSGMLPFDRSIFIPLETYQTLFYSESIDTILVRIADPEQADDIAEEINDLFEDQLFVLVPSYMIDMIGGVFT